MAFEGFPFIIGWELTLKCNLRCSHCGSSAGLARKNELTREEALSICEQLPALLVREVDFTGGEPLLCPYWAELGTRLRTLGITTRLISNGLLLDSETIRRIADAGVSSVGISVDGLEQTHDSIRGYTGLFRRVLNGIETLRRKSISVTVITTVNQRNVPELPALFEVLRSLHVGRWQLQPIFSLGRTCGNANLKLSDSAYVNFGRFVKEWTPIASCSGMELLSGDSFGYFTELDERKPEWRGCPAGRLLCGITSDGKVKGCLSLPDELVEGDLSISDLWDIWFNADSFAYTRGFSPEQLGNNCRGCNRAEQCHGGCSAMSYGNTGTFHNDPYCFYGIAERQEIRNPSAEQAAALRASG
jgi:radical SAM protein with 4Fe4S-binding SPASM domain